MSCSTSSSMVRSHFAWQFWAHSVFPLLDSKRNCIIIHLMTQALSCIFFDLATGRAASQLRDYCKLRCNHLADDTFLSAATRASSGAGAVALESGPKTAETLQVNQRSAAGLLTNLCKSGLVNHEALTGHRNARPLDGLRVSNPCRRQDDQPRHRHSKCAFDRLMLHYLGSHDLVATNQLGDENVVLSIARLDGVPCLVLFCA
jgi:hypothetical protein